jgi:CRISPR-associated protein Csm5
MLSAVQLKEKLTLDLRVISPVHIGTREGRLSALEFIYLGGWTYLIDEDAFGRFLIGKGPMQVDQFVKQAGSGPISVAEFLSKIPGTDLKQIVPKVNRLAIEGGSPSMTEFRPFIRDGNGVAYIPGSSLKGVMRTALLSKTLFLDGDLLNKVKKRVWDGVGEMKKKRVFYSQWLQDELLASYNLPGARQSPHRDILRCLTVRDAYPVGPVRTMIIPLRFLSRNSGGAFSWSSKKQSGGGILEIWVEAIVSGVFRAEFLWDRNLFERMKNENSRRTFPAAALPEVLGSANQMNSSLVQHEVSFLSAGTEGHGDALQAAKSLKTWYQGRKENLVRIGFGSGMLSTTVDHLFDEELRQKIRDICGHERPGHPAPKSRRVWKGAADQWYPFGWLEPVHDGEKSPAVSIAPPPPELPVLKPAHAPGVTTPDPTKSIPAASAPPPVTPVKRETWKGALLSWSPGTQMVTATFAGGKKAEVKGKEIVPASLHEKLFGRKKQAYAVVEVEPVGNRFRILKISEEQS